MTILHVCYKAQIPRSIVHLVCVKMINDVDIACRIAWYLNVVMQHPNHSMVGHEAILGNVQTKVLSSNERVRLEISHLIVHSEDFKQLTLDKDELLFQNC